MLSSRTRRCLALVAALVAAGSDPALALDPGLALHQLDHSKWTRNEGAPGQVGVLAQTRDGYLWLGSNRSLYRFDGVRFVQFRSADGSTVATVSTLLASPSGGLWAGLRAGGIAFIDGGRLTMYGTEDGLPGGTVYKLAMEEDGTLWAAVAEGLARFDGERWARIGESMGFPDSNVRVIYVDARGTVWAASGGGRLANLPRGAGRFVEVDGDAGWIGEIAESGDGGIWIAGRYRSEVRRIGGNTAIDVESSSIAFDRDGSLWIGTLGDGVWRIRDPAALPDRNVARDDDAIEVFRHDRGLSGDYTSALVEDDEGNVWFGTSGGLDRFRQGNVVQAPFPSGAHTFALAAGDDGAVWAGTINRPAMLLERDRVFESPMPPPATSAWRGPDGAVWMGGTGNLWRTDGRTLARVADLPGNEASFVRAMAGNRDGALWVSVNAMGLFRFIDGTWTPTPPPTGNPAQVMPVSAAAGPNGILWFGYRDNLVVARDGEAVRAWGPEEGVDIGHVTAVHPGEHRVWIAGQSGIALLDNERFRTLPLSDGGELSRIYAVIELPRPGRGASTGDSAPVASESWGDLWIHSTDGIFQVPAGEVARAAEDPEYRPLFRTFDASGLPDEPIQVLPLPTAIRGTDGRLWFATSNGVVWIDPARLQRSPGALPVNVEALRADEQYFPGTGHAQLPPLTRRVVIEYTAPSLSAPESVRFRYRLDGFDEAWIDGGARREVTYTGLAPGEYRFRIVAVNRDGVLGDVSEATTFTLLPAFYQRTSFYVACIAALLFALWLFYRLRLQQAAERLRLRLTERHEERERIARELHDTLLQTIQGLLLRFQSVADRMPADDASRRMLEDALDRADEALAEGRDRVKGLRTAAERDLPQALEAAGRDLARDGGVQFGCSVSGTPKPVQPETRDELYWIGREALVNAFRHAGASAIRAEVSFEARSLTLRIRDDGRGMQFPIPEGEDRGRWGIAGMHERAARIGATLELRTAPGSGCEIEVSVPAGSAYGR